MLLKVVFLFYWKKNYFNHCLKSILTKKYCLLIFFFSFSAWNSVKKKKTKTMTLHRCLFCSWILWWIVFSKRHISPAHIHHTWFLHPFDLWTILPIHWALYIPPKDSSVSLNKANTLEKMFLWGRGKFKSKLHIIFELWKIQFLPIKKHCFN